MTNTTVPTIRLSGTRWRKPDEGMHALARIPPDPASIILKNPVRRGAHIEGRHQPRVTVFVPRSVLHRPTGQGSWTVGRFGHITAWRRSWACSKSQNCLDRQRSRDLDPDATALACPDPSPSVTHVRSGMARRESLGPARSVRIAPPDRDRS